MSFEELILNPGLHHLAEKILTNVDLQNITNFRLLSKNCKSFIDTNKPLMVLQIHQACSVRNSRLVGLDNEELKQTLQSNHSFCHLFNKTCTLEDLQAFLTFMKDYFSWPIVIPYKTFEFHARMNILEYISYYNHFNILQIIIDNLDCSDFKDHFLNSTNIDGNFTTVTPIHLACQTGSYEIADMLTRFTNIAICDRHQRTPLHYASIFGHDKIVRRLLKKKDSELLITKAGDYRGGTPFHLSCAKEYQRNSEVLEVFLRYPEFIDPNIRDTDGYTPLHYACISGFSEATKTLLNYSLAHSGVINMNIGCRDYSKTPLHYASANGHSDVVETVIQHHKILKNVDLNIQDMSGNAALHLACNGGHFNVVKVFVDGFASVEGVIDWNITNDEEETPFDIVRKKHYWDILELISQIREDC